MVIKLEFRGSEAAREIIEGGSNYLVYGDPDIDGMVAAYLVCAYLRKKNKAFDYYINGNRSHGFYLPLEKIKGKTIIAVDFSMTEEEIKAVVDTGANIVLMDHHNISSDFIDYSNNGYRGIIINNQYTFEDSKWRFLSGAGVVYYVLSYFCPEMVSEDNKALVGITLLSDVRAIESPEAINILKTTYTADTPMINKLKNITKPDKVYSFGSIKMDRNFIDYNFSPKFNSMFRANMGYEAFEFMLGYPLSRELIEKCKDFQNTIVSYIMENLKGKDYGYLNCKYIDDENMDDVILKTASDPIFRGSMLSNYIGLVASRIKGAGCSMVYIREKDGTIQRGSFRGSADFNYLQLFKDLGGQAEGHRNAFGFNKIVDIDLQKFNDILFNMSKHINNDGRVIEIPNMSIVQNTKNKDIPELNTYCRSQNQTYFKYVGNRSSCQVVKKTERFMLWKVDGIEIKSFDLDLTPWDNYILPFKENGGYNVYYLRKDLF